MDRIYRAQPPETQDPNMQPVFPFAFRTVNVDPTKAQMLAQDAARRQQEEAARQAAIQQDSSPARTVQIDNFGNSRTQLVDAKAQEMNFKTPTMQGLLGEQHGQKMRIDYDISQLGNALIETSLKALGSPYEPKSKKCKTEAQSQRQVDGKVAQGQPKSAQQVEAIDG